MRTVLRWVNALVKEPIPGELPRCSITYYSSKRKRGRTVDT